ncbi:MAG: leucine-rich repeat protein, partial [Duncaniella sp.]|nr:leucine-rich repeat protein [Duncaniella sp.]
SITSLTIGNNVTKIPDYFLYNGSKIESLTIPNSVTSIGNSAFSRCTLTSLEFNAINCTYCGSSSYPAFPYIKSLTIGNNVTKIPDYFLSNGSKIQSLTIPNSVTSIGKASFLNNKYINSLTIGSGVLSIGDYAFSTENYSNRQYTIAKVFWMGNTAPTGYDNVKASVNYVANDQYSLSNQLKYQFLSSKFSVNGTIYIPVSPSERTCDVVDCEYSSQYTDVAIAGKVSNRGVEMSVLNVNENAFYNNDYLLQLNISNNGTIGNKSFYDCDALKKVEAANKGDIGSDAFYGCDSLQTVSIQNNGNIGSSAFYNSKKLTTVALGNNVTGILSSCFNGCSSLTEVTVPNSVIELGSSAFRDCTSLEKIIIGTGVSALPTRIFSGCSALSSLTVPNNILSVGDSAFSGCTSLGDIIFEDAEQNNASDVLTLGCNGSKPLFSDCPLDEVYIGRKLSYKTDSSYGYSPFYRNTSLRTVEITDAETQIYDNEFYGCSNLKSLKIGNGVTTIGNWAFSGCSSLDYFSAGYHVETIGKEAFSDCTGLTKYYSYSIVPPVCGDQAMDDINKWECMLYVPDESSDKYKAAPQWKEFFFIEEMDAVLVAEIRLDVTDVTLMPDETIQIKAEILPANATDQSVVWSSSDTSIATVSESGLITAVANGTATISAKSVDGNTEATCTVTV